MPVITVRNKVHTALHHYHTLCGRFRPLSVLGVCPLSLSETRFIQLFVTIIEDLQIFYRIHFFITVKAHDGLPRLPVVKICSDLFVTRSKTCRKRKGKNTREKQTNKSKTNVKQHLTNAQPKLLALHYLLLTFCVLRSYQYYSSG